MPAPVKKPITTLIPVQLSATAFTEFILPHLSMPKRGPKCKLGYHRVFNLILWVLYTPTVSPVKSSLVYFISIAYIDHPVWRSHREEAKRGLPSGHRITRNGAAMVSWLLPYAPTGLSLIAGWCVIGATPRDQPRTPV